MYLSIYQTVNIYNRLYLYSYIHPVTDIYYLPTPPLDTRSIFKRSLTGFNSEHSFS